MAGDQDLLEAAAKAAGIELSPLGTRWNDGIAEMVPWNPITDDGDALRLAVKLRIAVSFAGSATWFQVRTDPITIALKSEPHGDDALAATRRAIVRAAAAMAPKES